MGDVETQGSSYNAPRLHVAIEARKIVVSGEAAGLQIQLGPPAVPGRFDSCDLPPNLIQPVPRYSIKYFIFNTMNNQLVRNSPRSSP
ncbi:hypothetical protein HMPREF9540_03464 [Escherichia coli MS 115-1]|nr:hypothetical protein HMPREF9540_03464 [Escherichia coli MS 115-1]